MTRLLADLNLAPSALRWWEKGGVGIIGKGTPEISFLLGLVTAIRWSKEERAFVVEGYVSNGRSIIATQRAFQIRLHIRTGAVLLGRQSIAL